VSESINISSDACTRLLPNLRPSVTAATARWNTVYLGRRSTTCVAAVKLSQTRCLLTSPRSVGSTSISPATISGIPIAVSVPRASGRFARQQQTLPRPSLPDRVPDSILLTVLSCPFYGVTPDSGPVRSNRANPTRSRRTRR
jgi:hypothetical protein